MGDANIMEMSVNLTVNLLGSNCQFEKFSAPGNAFSSKSERNESYILRTYLLKEQKWMNTQGFLCKSDLDKFLKSS